MRRSTGREADLGAAIGLDNLAHMTNSSFVKNVAHSGVTLPCGGVPGG
jgi:hypothetical protein